MIVWEMKSWQGFAAYCRTKLPVALRQANIFFAFFYIQLVVSKATNRAILGHIHCSASVYICFCLSSDTKN